jgi:type IV pilus assembly protein PilA
VLADGVKTAMVEYYNNKGDFATDPGSMGLESSVSIGGKYVGCVDVATKGKITITYGPNCGSSFGSGANSKIVDKTLIYSAIATATGGTVAWSCSTSTSGQVDNKYLPQVCRR